VIDRIRCLEDELALVRATLFKKQGYLEEVAAERNKLREELSGISEELESAWQNIEHKNLLLKALAEVRDRLREDLASCNEALAAFEDTREELESARRVWKCAEDATWAFASIGGLKLEDYVESLRHACREHRKRFGGRE